MGWELMCVALASWSVTLSCVLTHTAGNKRLVLTPAASAFDFVGFIYCLFIYLVGWFFQTAFLSLTGPAILEDQAGGFIYFWDKNLSVDWNSEPCLTLRCLCRNVTILSCRSRNVTIPSWSLLLLGRAETQACSAIARLLACRHSIWATVTVLVSTKPFLR